MQDKTLVCRDCGRKFTFSVSEQEFYAQKGFSNEPGRCPECRASRKAERNSYGGRGYGRSSDRPPRQMYPAVCSACGKETEVPFQPTSGKPVYCSSCFEPRRSSRY